MKKIFILSLAFLATISVMAQGVKQDIEKNKNVSGSNYLAYPGPDQRVLTAAPAGFEPFYISHYGRHGSRFLIGTGAYDKPYATLMRADSLGKLTQFGQNVLWRVSAIRSEARNRDGELTPLGAQQHREIAQRMYERFPQVFAGETDIDAKSTVVIRCILSMENELQQLLVNNPKLKIRHDASHFDMYYMNYDNPILSKQRYPDALRKQYDELVSRHSHPERLMKLIFNDDNYWKNNVNGQKLFSQLFKLASNVQSTELRHQLTLYDLFTDEELYDEWKKNNASWYIGYGPCPMNGGKQPFSQSNLLRNIIHETDSLLPLKHPGATLRFGHEVVVMPLACLLELNNCGKQITDLEKLDEQGWVNYRIFPMGCNIQFVFYRNASQPDDIIFKVLLNENEATLPIREYAKSFYRWKDFKEYFEKKLETYR